MATKKAPRRRRTGVFEMADSPFWWGSYIDEKGNRKRVSLGKRRDSPTGYQDAEADLWKRRSRARELRETGQAPPSKDALSTILPRYLKHQKVRLSPESYLRTEGIVHSHLEPYFGQMPMNSISRDTISQYASERAGKVSAASVVKELNTLKHLFNLMVDEWKLSPYNPALRLKPPRKVPAGRVRYLQPTELRAVIAACPDWAARDRVARGLHRHAPGRDSGPALDACRSERKPAHAAPNQERRRSNRLLNALAADVIKGQWKQGVKPTTKVFPQTDNFTPDNVSKGFGVVCKNLELHDFHFHDLRHTAASWMRMQGADVHTIAQVLGHKDMRMATRYQHLSPGFLASAVGTLDTIFGQPKQIAAGTEQ
jgi:integrase